MAFESGGIAYSHAEMDTDNDDDDDNDNDDNNYDDQDYEEEYIVDNDNKHEDDFFSSFHVGVDYKNDASISMENKKMTVNAESSQKTEEDEVYENDIVHEGQKTTFLLSQPCFGCDLEPIMDRLRALSSAALPSAVDNVLCASDKPGIAPDIENAKLADRQHDAMEQLPSILVLDILVQRSPTGGANRSTEALLIGRASDGASACIRVLGWYPHLFVRAPLNWIDSTERNALLRDLLHEKLEAYFEQRETAIVVATSSSGDGAPTSSTTTAMESIRGIQGVHLQNNSTSGSKNHGNTGKKRREPNYIRRISAIRAQNIRGFCPHGPSLFLKIEVNAPYLVRALCAVFTGYPIQQQQHCAPEDNDAQHLKKKRTDHQHDDSRIFQPARARGVTIQLHPFNMAPILVDGQTETFNSHIDAVQQFMVDMGLVGCQWVRIQSFPKCTAFPNGIQPFPYDNRKNTHSQENHANEDHAHYSKRNSSDTISNREEEHNEALRLLLQQEHSIANGEETIDFVPIDPNERRTQCVHEWHISVQQLLPLDVNTETSIAPLHILSFDIEAAGRRGVFPQASDDPVIQIAMQFRIFGRPPSYINPILLSLKECDPIEGVDVVSFDDERLLLRAFRDLAMAFDTDVFTGYNILSFDFPYLHDRAAALCGEKTGLRKNIREPGKASGYHNDAHCTTITAGGGDGRANGSLMQYFDDLARVRGMELELRDMERLTQMGKRKCTRVTIPGRVSLDVLVALQNSQHRLESYKLDEVSKHFLKDQKVDLPFTQITPMWNAGSTQRRELGIYCLKDALLPLDLDAKLDLLTQTIEMARATGILFDAVLQRGVMMRNTSLLLRRALARRLLFPNLQPPTAPSVGNHYNSNNNNNNKDKHATFPKTGLISSNKTILSSTVGRVQRYTGATVLDPICGIHRFVAVLDFSAMYPSIIRAHNLCYSTIVLEKSDEEEMAIMLSSGGASTAIKTSRRERHCDDNNDAYEFLHICGHTYVPETCFKGLIPEVVEHLQNCRGLAKKAYAKATDPMTKQVCKARELAFKVAGNGVYGALGSSVSILPMMAIAESVTALGRADILMVKQMAEDQFGQGSVVYGDTDSVFVVLPIAHHLHHSTADSIAQASDFATDLADRINARLRAPKKIEYEKVFGTMLLLSKKRYAGLKFEPSWQPGMVPTIDVKGLQSVRRDGCPLLRHLVRDVIQSILESGSEVEAAASVRRRLLDIVEDKVPLSDYAVKKTLRKSILDCAYPMRRAELDKIRSALKLPKSAAQLSYAEQDQAIYAKVTLPWRMRVNLPHVLLAWKLRLKDPGSAPVPGESISYIVTHNGEGKKVFEKVETANMVAERHIPVDRQYYLRALRKPMENIFGPILIQRLRQNKAKERDEQGHVTLWDKDTIAEHTSKQLDTLLWNIIHGRPLTQSNEKRKASIDASPLMQAFKRQALLQKTRECSRT